MAEEAQDWTEADLASLGEKLASLSLTDGERAAFAALLENDVGGFAGGLDLFSFGVRKKPEGMGVRNIRGPSSNPGIRTRQSGQPRIL